MAVPLSIIHWIFGLSIGILGYPHDYGKRRIHLQVASRFNASPSAGNSEGDMATSDDIHPELSLSDVVTLYLEDHPTGCKWWL